MNFKQFILERVEVETSIDEAKFLTYIINMLLRKRNQAKALPKSNRFKTSKQIKFKKDQTDIEKQSGDNFRRMFNFNPDVDRKTNRHLGWFSYEILRPPESVVSEEDKQKIEKILNLSIQKYRVWGSRIDFVDMFNNLDDGELYDKGFRILAILFLAVARNFAERGHGEWERYLFKRNLKPETKKHFGDIFDELD